MDNASWNYYLEISEQELPNTMHLAANFIKNCELTGSISDKELDLTINTLSALVTFFEIRGQYFGLVTTRLREEWERYESFKRARQRNVCGDTCKGKD